jgi:hypothetical protein
MVSNSKRIGPNMSRSRKVLGLIQPKLPDTMMCGDVIVVRPTDYVLRGFCLDSTPQKDHMVLWKVVMPLHRPFPHLILSYSQSAEGPSDGRFVVGRTGWRQAVPIVGEEIARHLESLRKLQKPADFLAHIARMAGNSQSNVRTDFALAHYLVGNIKQSLRMFRALAAEVRGGDPQRPDPLHEVIAGSLAQLERDPDGLRPIIDGWRDDNIERLGLAESRAARPALRLV